MSDVEKVEDTTVPTSEELAAATMKFAEAARELAEAGEEMLRPFQRLNRAQRRRFYKGRAKPMTAQQRALSESAGSLRGAQNARTSSPTTRQP